MKKKTDTTKNIAVFEEKKARKTWHNEQWYFSVPDVVQVLTEENYLEQRQAKKLFNKKNA